jgi:hypothetical protein
MNYISLQLIHQYIEAGKSETKRTSSLVNLMKTGLYPTKKPMYKYLDVDSGSKNPAEPTLVLGVIKRKKGTSLKKK